MQKRQIILIVILLAVIVAGMFVFAYLSRTASAPSTPVETQQDVAQEKGTPEITSISAKHYFTDPPGVHTLAGELLLPTPCDLISTNAVLLDNNTRALVSFDVINNSSDACEQKATTQRFKVGFQAPKDIKIEAVFNGKPIELTLTPAEAGEKPSDFQLFDKG